MRVDNDKCRGTDGDMDGTPYKMSIEASEDVIVRVGGETDELGDEHRDGRQWLAWAN